jgi:hypothetical protein
VKIKTVVSSFKRNALSLDDPSTEDRGFISLFLAGRLGFILGDMGSLKRGYMRLHESKCFDGLLEAWLLVVLWRTFHFWQA